MVWSPKQRLNEFFWTILFDEKVHLTDLHQCFRWSSKNGDFLLLSCCMCIFYIGISFETKKVHYINSNFNRYFSHKILPRYIYSSWYTQYCNWIHYKRDIILNIWFFSLIWNKIKRYFVLLLTLNWWKNLFCLYLCYRDWKIRC